MMSVDSNVKTTEIFDESSRRAATDCWCVKTSSIEDETEREKIENDDFADCKSDRWNW